MAQGNQDLKTVARFNDRIQAEIVAGMLRENGVPEAVFGAVSSYPSMNLIDLIEVKVNSADYDLALKLINE